MAEDDYTALLWGAAHAARVGILCNGFAARLVGGHGASAESIIVQCKCKGCGSRSPSRAPEGNLFGLEDWSRHCGANTEPLRLSVFSVVQPGDPKARVPLLEWLLLANEAMGGESLHRRQLCVLFPGPDEEEGTPYHWRAGTIRHIDPVTGAAEVKYHDDRRKRSKAHLYLPLAVTHWARCPPPPETPPRTVAEGCQPLPTLLLPGVPLPPRPPPQPTSSGAPSPPSQQQPAAPAATAAAAVPMAATAAHTVTMEVAPPAPAGAKESAPHGAAQSTAAGAAAVRPKSKREPDSSRRPGGPGDKPTASASHAVSLSLLAAAAAADAAAAAAAAAPTKPGPMRRYTKRTHCADDAQPPLSWTSPQHKEQKRRDGAAPGEGRPWAEADARCPQTAVAASTAATATAAMAATAAAPPAGSWAASAWEGGAANHHNGADGVTGANCGGRGSSSGGVPPSWSSAAGLNSHHSHHAPSTAAADNAVLVTVAPTAAGNAPGGAAAVPQVLSYAPAPPAPPQQPQPQPHQFLVKQDHAAEQVQQFLTGAAAVPSLSTFSSSSADLESLLNGDDNDAFTSTAEGSPAAAVDEFAALTAAAAGLVGAGVDSYCHNAYSSGADSDGGRRGAGLAYGGGGGSGVFAVRQQQPSQEGNTRSPSLVPSMPSMVVAAPEPQQLQNEVAAPAFVPMAQPTAAFISGGGGCGLAQMEWQPARTSYSSSGGSGGMVPAYDAAATASAAASAAAATVAAAAAESLAAAAGNYTMRVYWESYYSLMNSPQVVPSASPTPVPIPMTLPQLSPRAAGGSNTGSSAFWQSPTPVLAHIPHHPVLVSSGSSVFCAPAGGNACAMPAAAPPLPLPPAVADEGVADANLKILLSEIEELQWPLPQPIAT